MVSPCCLYVDTLIKSPTDIGKYYEGCEWAPDGTCLMTVSSDKMLYIYDTPNMVVSSDDELLNNNKNGCYEWKPTVSVLHSEPIYDYQWYPLMQSNDSTTSFFVTSCKDQPIQLIDAYFGNIIHSFLCFDDKQCVISPISLKFTPNGQNLVAGFKKKIRFFDLGEIRAAGEMKCNNGKSPLNSLISCISFCSTTFENSGLMACGSYSSQVNIYDYYNGDCYACFNIKDDIATYYKSNHTIASINSKSCGGITKVLWSHNGNIVTCGTRKCDWIIQYDIRMSDKPLSFLPRSIRNNQKYSISIDKNENYMFSSCCDGNLLIWDNNDNNSINEPISKIALHYGPFTGCALHPYNINYLATSSGSRIFDYPGDTFINKENNHFYLPDSKLCLWYIGEWIDNNFCK